ncbi:MAG: hypothetical protein LAT81_16185 [Oceanicaulis sp.]|nr:hypothetical protein [Oceanicaulis sp.]
MDTIYQAIADNLHLGFGGILILFLLYRQHKLQEQLKAQKPQAFPRLKRFVALWPEVYMIPLLVIIAMVINALLLWVWPDAIFLGPEHLQTILYKALAAFIAYFLFFVRDRLDWPEWAKWYEKEDDENELNELTPWQRQLLYTLRLAAFVVVFALL